jgi:YHS domain-containing protein
MRRFILILCVLVLGACVQQEHKPARAAKRPVVKAEIQTIDNTPPSAAVMQPPPVLPDEAPAPKPLNATQPEDVPVLTPADEQVRAQLPFAPAIGMDPVDGAKISIRANTPMVDMKSKIFYFSSEENKQKFLASPEQYIKGPFSHT